MFKKLARSMGIGMAIAGITPAIALNFNQTLGKEGIDLISLQQLPLNLTGKKIAIGQVEIGRPGKLSFDKTVSNKSQLSLAGLFYQNGWAKPNNNVDNHANMVATVMVSKDKLIKGVAPGARLYSSAVGSLKKNSQTEECLSTQHISEQNGGDLRAINFSFGESLEKDEREDAKLDGNSLLTQCIDWLAKNRDVVFVIAGNQGKGGIPIPTDNFNGITVAYSAKKNGVYSKVDFANLSAFPIGIGSRLIKREINSGQRRAIGLVAPGSQIVLYNLQGQITKVSGTSFAAPHLTASVAILQEFGDRQIFKKALHWSIDSRRHQVMKAVFLNSADKIEDRGDGLLLGMTRTVSNKNNQNWFESDAYKNSKIPLDIQMGTGHLNLNRAYQQFFSGQWSGDIPVNNLGWDYGKINPNGDKDYVIARPLKKDSFIAITLAWDRLVALEDSDRNGRYDPGEKFRDRGLNDLNLALIANEGKEKNATICESISEVDSVEHIFCRVPTTGSYKIRVNYKKQVNEETQDYGLAWWSLGN
jgi:subtilisin family serine protease